MDLFSVFTLISCPLLSINDNFLTSITLLGVHSLEFWSAVFSKYLYAYLLQGGQWILDLTDFFGGGFIIYILATIEVVALFWINS